MYSNYDITPKIQKTTFKSQLERFTYSRVSGHTGNYASSVHKNNFVVDRNFDE